MFERSFFPYFTTLIWTQVRCLDLADPRSRRLVIAPQFDHLDIEVSLQEAI